MSEERGKFVRKIVPILLAATVSLLSACAGIGPGTVNRDRFDYVSSISESWKRQMLLNLLKVRYFDAPVFMDVASVINAYELTGEVNLSGQLAGVGRGDQFVNMGAAGRYSDKPTITYQPLAGDKFTRSLLLPIPIRGILFLLQSGYPADFVLRCCVNSINSLQNAYGGAGRLQAGDPTFRELISAMQESQAAGGMVLRMKTIADKQTAILFLRPSTDEAISAPARRIRKLLALDESAGEFHIAYGIHPENDREIAMLSRSILQVLIDLASYFDVPEADRTEGSVYTVQRTSQQQQLFPPLITVRCGPSAPGDAYVSVNYRNHWFWIDDRDIKSKQMFNFTLLLFSLTETGSEPAAPIVTIPAR